MGGTSADIGIVTPRGISEATARDTWIAGDRVLLPMIAVHTVGAGGGSVAYMAPGGAFRVGPRSAGARPGPASYGLGGTEPTVTDANLVLGRLRAEHFLGGAMKVKRDLAENAVAQLGSSLHLSPLDAAAGILTLVNHNMANAVRSRTIQKGHDPRQFTLVAFGGAGPLHAADLARSLDVPEVIVPSYPGITSAMGLLSTDLKYDLIQNEFMLDSDADLDRLNRDFKRLHEEEYGHAFPGNPIELVNIRVVATGRLPKMPEVPPPSGGSLKDAQLDTADVYFAGEDGKQKAHRSQFYERTRLPVGAKIEGPAVLLQVDSTTLVPPGATAEVLKTGDLLIKV